MESGKLDELIANIGTLSSIYSWPPTLFVQKLRDSMNKREQEQESSSDEEVNEEEEIRVGGDENDMVGKDFEQLSEKTNETQTTDTKKEEKTEEMDLLGMDDDNDQ